MARSAAAIALSQFAPVETPAPTKRASAKSKAEEMLSLQLLSYPNIRVVRQLQFAKSMKRRWRFDFAFPKYKVAVELDGVVMKRINGTWFTMGRHADVKGMRADNQKGIAAIMYGWSVLHFLQDEVKPRRAINTTLRVLSQRGWKA